MDYAIFSLNSNQNIIDLNNLTQCDQGGIFMSGSSWYDILGNNISDCDSEPIYLFSSSNNNAVIGNDIHDNDLSNSQGILMDTCSDNDVIDNRIWNNQYGISLIQSTYCLIDNNTVTGNTGSGIYFKTCSDNTILNNTILNNDGCGLILSEEDGSQILGNNISVNGVSGTTAGIWLDKSF